MFFLVPSEGDMKMMCHGFCKSTMIYTLVLVEDNNNCLKKVVKPVNHHYKNEDTPPIPLKFMGFLRVSLVIYGIYLGFMG